MTIARPFLSSSSQSPRPAPPRRVSELGGERPLPVVVAPFKLLVYSHDTFGLGNIRRMTAICEHLCTRFPRMTALVLTGSPMLHSFRLTPGIDYVKLPCLRRDEEGVISVKYLNLNLDTTVGL